MTKKESLKECRDMWRWVEEHPERGKEGYMTEVRPGVDVLNNCYCCEYLKQQGISLGPKNCVDNCPLISLWLKGFDPDQFVANPRRHYGPFPCLHGTSIYEFYEDLEPADNEDDWNEAERIAGIIAKAAEEELRKLEAA